MMWFLHCKVKVGWSDLCVARHWTLTSNTTDLAGFLDYLFKGPPSEYESDAELNECMDRIYGLAY